MHIWQSRYDSSTRTHHHVVQGPFGHAVLAQAAAFTFKALRVSLAIFDGNLWWPVHVEQAIIEFEQVHGKDAERGAYNSARLEEAVRSRELVRGEHAGYSDLYQPILVDGHVIGVLVAGPFARSRATAADLLDRWRWLTGRPAHPTDPEFASYLQATFSTLVLEGKRAALFERLLDRFARLLAQDGPADRLTNEADVLRAELEQARAVERAWEVVGSMVDERTARRWHGKDQVWTLGDLRLSRVPDAVLVALTASRAPVADPVEEAVRRDAFQRRSVELAGSAGHALAGRVGGHGVVFVSAAIGSAERRKRHLLELAERAGGLGRRLGLSTHFGAVVGSATTPLDRSYHAALGAAQAALTQRTRLVIAEPDAHRSGHSLRHLREELGRAVEQTPEVSGAQFDRYLEAVALHCGHRFEPAQAHLEVGFERMAEALLQGGTLDPRSLGELRSALDRASNEAHGVSDLFDAYRRAASDLAQAVSSPLTARHDRSLRAALAFIREHHGEALSLAKVARVAGLSPAYFSEVFSKRQGMPFERYVRGLRLERAKQLLTASQVPVTRVAQLCGFRSLQYFARVFRAELGATPSAFRKAGNAASPRRKRTR